MRILLYVFAAWLLATPLHAQDTPKGDVALGYSSMWVGKGFTFFLNGGGASVAVNPNPWFGLVADFGAHYAEPGVDLTTRTYLLGPRFSYRHLRRFTPFAQVLAGGLHASAVTTGFTNASNAFAFGGGAGCDLGLDSHRRFALRPQLEWLGFRAKGNTTGVARISLGIVVRFGNRR